MWRRRYPDVAKQKFEHEVPDLISRTNGHTITYSMIFREYSDVMWLASLGNDRYYKEFVKAKFGKSVKAPKKFYPIGDKDIPIITGDPDTDAVPYEEVPGILRVVFKYEVDKLYGSVLKDIIRNNKRYVLKVIDG